MIKELQENLTNLSDLIKKAEQKSLSVTEEYKQKYEKLVEELKEVNDVNKKLREEKYISCVSFLNSIEKNLRKRLKVYLNV